MNRLDMYKLDGLMQYREWANKMPALSFSKNWLVRIIPPFAGAMVRFCVSHKDRPLKEISIYFDCHDNLGVMGRKPHWKIYPDYEENNARFMLGEEAEMLKAITKALRKKK